MTSGSEKPKFVIVGAGLGGALAAVSLGQAGYHVDVYEMRGDLRTAKTPGGRSINLALSYRGICALERVGLAEKVLEMAVPMRGRLMHSPGGQLSFQRYGKDDTQAINSVSRGGLNCILLDAAQTCKNVRLFFHHKCTTVDTETAAVELTNTETDERITINDGVVIGADGAFSAVRGSMQRLDRFNYRQDYLEHGYMELTIPAGPGGEFQLRNNALHIWPRRSFMMIALPNRDGSFTCTLFWPFEGPHSFAALKERGDVVPYFRQHFPDAVGLIPTLEDDFMRNPVSSLATIRSGPWFVHDRIVLLGDAAHAVVPFYGQGMNASFEDVLVLVECLQRHTTDRHAAFAEYHALRKPNVDVLADLALANFIEMRDRTGSRLFLLKKKSERWLHYLFPKWFIPLYTMATFTRMPYTQAVRRARRQNQVVIGIVALLVLAVLVALGAALW